MNIKMIVGLSNPIEKYYHTRHNIGSVFIHQFCSMHNIFLKQKSYFGYIGQYEFNKLKLWLLIPNTYMNHSGRSILHFASFYNIAINNILVIHDELDLLPGIIKLKYGNGHNGHNGLRSIIDIFGRKNFFRISIGIGRPSKLKSISSYVLSKFTNTEKELISITMDNVIKDMNILINQKKFFIQSKIYSLNNI